MKEKKYIQNCFYSASRAFLTRSRIEKGKGLCRHAVVARLNMRGGCLETDPSPRPLDPLWAQIWSSVYMKNKSVHTKTGLTGGKTGLSRLEFGLSAFQSNNRMSAEPFHSEG